VTRLIEEHWNDVDGNPAGGVTSGQGFTISWQNGPLGRDEDRKEPNGAFVEDIIRAAMKRLQFYQRSKFNCGANARAIDDLDRALFSLEARTAERCKRGVEGTHEE